MASIIISGHYFDTTLEYQKNKEFIVTCECGMQKSNLRPQTGLCYTAGLPGEPMKLLTKFKGGPNICTRANQ